MSTMVKTERQRAIRELVNRSPIGSQDELVLALARRGFPVTQATVSRDITELGLVKVARGNRHVYVAPEDLAPSMIGSAGPVAPPTAPADERLRRILADVPVQVRRSGLILLLVGTPGTASVIAQAIDDSSLHEQEGTLAGDDTLLVLFADESRLDRWLERFQRIAGEPIGTGIASSSLLSPSAAHSLAPSAAGESPDPDSLGSSGPSAIPIPTVSEVPR